MTSSRPNRVEKTMPTHNSGQERKAEARTVCKDGLKGQQLGIQKETRGPRCSKWVCTYLARSHIASSWGCRACPAVGQRGGIRCPSYWLKSKEELGLGALRRGYPKPSLSGRRQETIKVFRQEGRCGLRDAGYMASVRTVRPLYLNESEQPRGSD